MLRSIPTTAPTNALTTTSSENCGRFSRSPSRTTGGTWRNRGVSQALGLRACCRRLKSRICSISSGFGGTSVKASIKACRSLDSIGFHRRSKPMVLIGLPLKPAPHTDPEKWPGYTSMSSGSVISRSWMLRYSSGGVLTRASREIRSTYRANEERVPREDEPRLFAAFQVGHEQAHAVRRMAWRMEDLHLRIPQLDHLTVLQCGERPFVVGRFVQAVRGVDTARQLRSTRSMIGMHVCIDDMRDLHVLAGGKCGVCVHIFGTRVNDRAAAQRAAAKEVRRATAIEVVEGSEDHGVPPLSVARMASGAACAG